MARKFSRSFLVGCLLLIGSGAAFGVDGAASGPSAVVLAPVQVNSHLLQRCHCQVGLKYVYWGPISTVEVDEAELGSLLAKAGLRVGDRVISLNGHPIRGMPPSDFLFLMSIVERPVLFEVQSVGESIPKKIPVTFPNGFWTWDHLGRKMTDPDRGKAAAAG